MIGLKEVFGFLEEFLKDSKFVAGTDFATVADLCILATYTSAAAYLHIYANFDDWPRTKQWAENVKGIIPNYAKANGDGVEGFMKMITGIKEKAKKK